MPGQPLTIDGKGGPITALPFVQEHGDIQSLGFRFGAVAYSSDLNDMPDASAEALAGLDLWIVDALRYHPHPSHFSVADALAWIERLKPARAILTNMHADLDYEALRVSLPAGRRAGVRRHADRACRTRVCLKIELFQPAGIGIDNIP